MGEAPYSSRPGEITFPREEPRASDVVEPRMSTAVATRSFEAVEDPAPRDALAELRELADQVRRSADDADGREAADRLAAGLSVEARRSPELVRPLILELLAGDGLEARHDSRGIPCRVRV